MHPYLQIDLNYFSILIVYKYQPKIYLDHNKMIHLICVVINSFFDVSVLQIYYNVFKTKLNANYNNSIALVGIVPIVTIV